HGVVAELFLRELMFRVADLAIRRHALRVELHLHLHIRRGDLQRARKLADKIRGRFLRRIDETVTAIALAREDFDQIVVESFPADAEAIESDALFAMHLDLPLKRIR